MRFRSPRPGRTWTLRPRTSAEVLSEINALPAVFWDGHEWGRMVPMHLQLEFGEAYARETGLEAVREERSRGTGALAREVMRVAGMPRTTVYARATCDNFWHVATETYPAEAVTLCRPDKRTPASQFSTGPLVQEATARFCPACEAEQLDAATLDRPALEAIWREHFGDEPSAPFPYPAAFVNAFSGRVGPRRAEWFARAFLNPNGRCTVMREFFLEVLARPRPATCSICGGPLGGSADRWCKGCDDDARLED